MSPTESNDDDGTFLYFAFGSNLLEERLKLLNPSAKYYTNGIIHGYKLVFSRHSQRWGGCSASIIPSPGDFVWGVVYTLSNLESDNLDSQEGVSRGVYKRIEVKVQTSDSREIICRCYQLNDNKSIGRPSPCYKDVIVRGAVQHSLPKDYIEKLKQIEHNENKTVSDIYKSLNLPSPIS